MANYTIESFIKETAQRDERNGFFELENPQTLEINLDGMVWMKLGSMIGYTGAVKFKRQSSLAGGIGKFLKKKMTGEGASLMSAIGKGAVYLADSGKRVRIIDMSDDTIFVNGNDLLALQDTLDHDIKMMKSAAGMLGGGLFNVKVSGSGMCAFTTHGTPITLMVTPDKPVFTDPSATVAWSGSLSPKIKTDISIKDFLGRGSGEGFQLQFEGNGWVVLQPYEEVYAISQ